MRNVWKESASNTWNFLLAKNRCLPSLQCDILNMFSYVFQIDEHKIILISKYVETIVML